MIMKLVLFLFLLLSLQVSFLFAGGNNIVGLQNYGETCYANAVFQLLYHNDDFRSSLKSYLRENPLDSDRNLVTLNDIFDEMDAAVSHSKINPPTFEALPEGFDPKIQYDVAEVLEKYQAIKGFDWKPFAIEIQKTINRIIRTEFFLELFLNVPETDSLTLQDLLALHFEEKKIKSLPKNLLIRIKRIHKIDGNEEKITDKISVPESLSLSEYSLRDIQNQAQYRLDAFIEHCGQCSTGGHYLIYLHHKATDTYIAINDEKITEISEGEFVEKASRAYLFLYKQL